MQRHGRIVADILHVRPQPAVTDQRGLSFLDAVRELAAAAGLDMPARGDRDDDQAGALRVVTEAAARWFAARLDDPEGRPARDALDARGIRPDTARAFGIGFAPDTRGALKAALGRSAGFRTRSARRWHPRAISTRRWPRR